jgi:glucose-1-phosphate adenylyltransferase
MGYNFDDYWADIGTICRFYEVNLELASPMPPFELNLPNRPIYTRPRFLPPTDVQGATLNQVLLADGCPPSHCCGEEGKERVKSSEKFDIP